MSYQGAAILQPMIAAQSLLTSRLVHKDYYPFTIFATLHALRISIAYQNNVRANNLKGKLTWGNYIAGYLIMAWGGTVISHVLMSLPPPMLYNYHPYLNYISVHFVATAFFHWFPSLLDLQIIDPLFTPIDGILRSTSIAAALTILTSGALPSTHLPLTTSPLTPLIIGAAAGSGGGVMAGTLQAWTNDWNLGTISAFKVGAGVLGSTDVWSGALTGFVYALLTRPSLYPQIASAVRTYLGVAEVDKFSPLLTPKDSQALTTILLITIFTWRVYVVHYMNPASVSGSSKKLAANPKGSALANITSRSPAKPQRRKGEKGTE